VARTGRPFFRQGANAGILILERYFFPSENLISHCGFIPPPRSVMTTGGLCLSQTRRTSGGSLAIPTGVIFPSLISFQDPRYVILRPVGPLSPRRIPYHHLSSSKRLYHPSIQPKHRASSRAWRDGNLSFFGGCL